MKLSKRAVVSKLAETGLSCEHRRYVRRLIDHNISNTFEVQTHQNCGHNELRALYNRHLRDYDTAPDQGGIRLAHRQFRRISRLIGRLTPTDIPHLLSRLSSRKKRLYTRAAATLEDHGIEERDSLVKMFIKPDRFVAEEISSKEPRAIQYRGPRYNLALQRYLHPFEERYYKLTNSSRGGAVKGLNSWQRAAIFQEALTNFVDPIVVNLDFSKFDAHLHPLMLAEERATYSRCYGDVELDWLLQMQHHNLCWTQRGTHYRVEGTRLSGDVNTGLGNTMIAECIVRAWACSHKLRIIPFVDGDDIIFFTERCVLPPLDFSAWGMEATYDILEPAQLTHCQCKCIVVGKRWRMVRDPFRAISHGSWTVRPYPLNVLPGLLCAMGMSELACSNGVPILQSWSLAQIRISGTTPWGKFDEDIAFRAKLEGRSIPLDITMESRESFEVAFGIPISTQLAIESEIDALTSAAFLPAQRVDVCSTACEASTSETA